MKILLYKDQILYLMLLAMLAYVGVYFIPSYSPAWLSKEGDKVFAHILIFLNSVLIFLIFSKINQNKITNFLITLIYLFNPLKLPSFLFPYQLQAMIGEFLLILSMWLFQNKRLNFSVIILMLSMIFNSMLIALVPITWFLGMSRRNKTLLSIHALVIFIFIFPLYHGMQTYYQNNLKTIFYILSMAFVPVNLPLLNNAVLNSNLYQLKYILIVLILFFSYFIWKRKKIGSFNAGVFAFTIILSCFLPFKYYGVLTEGYYFYFNPQFYPMLLLMLLYGLNVMIAHIKTSMSFNIVLCMFAIFLLVMNISYQREFQFRNLAWRHAMSILPDSYNFEERVKLKYVYGLIETNQLIEADKFIAENRIKFPKPIWYKLYLQVALQQKDYAKVDQIQKELVEKSIPYDN